MGLWGWGVIKRSSHKHLKTGEWAKAKVVRRGGGGFEGVTTPAPPENFNDTLTVKSVQSALSDLLITSATHGTFSRPSTKRGLILIGLELNTNARESFEHC